MKPRQHLQFCTTCAIALLFISNLLAVEEPYERPNIVFIFTDDHAVHSIGAYGSRINKTPNIDRLAQRGMVFENSFCTNAVCGPSRACIQTGKHSHINGFKSNGYRFNSEQWTFPKALRKAGYQTAVIGKWHLGSDPIGYDYWEILPSQGNYYNPDFYKISLSGSPGGSDNMKSYEGYCTDVVTNLGLEWLDKRDTNKPFLLMIQHKAPHRPWMPALRHITNYADEEIPEPATLFDTHENRDRSLSECELTIDKQLYYSNDLKIWEDVPWATDFEKRIQNQEYKRMTDEQKQAWDAVYGPRNREFLKDAPKGKDLIRWKYQRYIKDYLRCIDAVDENVGRVLDYLDQHGLAENTVVIYSSDQGFFLGDHGWYDKRWMFEESMRMPFIISWPEAVEPGSRNRNLIQNIDYAPTFLEMAGAEIPRGVQGLSLVPTLKDKNKSLRDCAYYHYYATKGGYKVPSQEGVRTDRYKLINFYGSEGFNLFDLKKDPMEIHDVSKDPAYQDVFEEMKGKLDKLRQEYKVTNPA